MTRNRHIVFLKYFSYVLLLLLAYMLQTTPRLFEIAGVKPNLLIPAAACIAMFEGELAGGIYGACAGLLCDFASFTLFGFNGVLMLAGCAAIGLLTMYLVQLKLTNALWLGASALLLRGLLEYFFYFQIWGFEESGRVLLFATLPRVLYSTVAIVPFFFMVRRMKGFFDTKLKI